MLECFCEHIGVEVGGGGGGGGEGEGEGHHMYLTYTHQGYCSPPGSDAYGFHIIISDSGVLIKSIGSP